MASIASFYSVKLNSAQRNYLVHEIEMLARVETMPLPGAEMGCPESLKEFAVRMHDCFILRGPGE